MNSSNDYGVVYTPSYLADFVSKLMIYDDLKYLKTTSESLTILDPSCGENSLLSSMNRIISDYMPQNSAHFIGVDIDESTITNNQSVYKDESQYTFHSFDAITPSKTISSVDYWEALCPNISYIIANPPWSSEKIYEECELTALGYVFDTGQYDSYVLFIELCLKIAAPDSYCAFILPDSIFTNENNILRKHLAMNTQIRVIARLGEKLFDNINRSTSVIVIKNTLPDKKSSTKCFRLKTEERKQYLNNNIDLYTLFTETSHEVFQSRFTQNNNYLFDIDTKKEDEILLRKIEKDQLRWSEFFHFGRGVEISKNGEVVVCVKCNKAQGFSKKQRIFGEKTCVFCNAKIEINPNCTTTIIKDEPTPDLTAIYVGENIRRYNIVGKRFIKMNVQGINYKDPKLYSPPKILIRKTGLGINASIDNSSTYINQTIYSCNFLEKNSDIPLEYYLGVLNSRLIFYYYLKVYGENEWKSHPYLTKSIIFSLPLRKVNSQNKSLAQEISSLTKKILKKYDRNLDLQLENMIFSLYDLSSEEQAVVKKEINHLPNLGAINHMKF